MPLYRVQLKQGRRTITNHIEAKSVSDAVQFFESLTTMKVSEVLEVKYQSDIKPPIDDYNYFALFKAIIKNDNRMSKQIVLNNLKLTKNEQDVYQACKQHLEVANSNVSAVACSLFKRE
jgi:hypothetical protein